MTLTSEQLQKLQQATPKQLNKLIQKYKDSTDPAGIEKHTAAVAELRKRQDPPPVKTQSEQTSALDTLNRFVGNLNQGLYGTFGDEIAGLLNVPLSYATGGEGSVVDRYKTVRDYQRGQNRRFSEDNPVSSFGMQLGASLGPGGLLTQIGKRAINPALEGIKTLAGEMPRRASLLFAPQTRTQAVAQGVPVGAAAGVGGSETPLSDPAGLLMDAGFGAVTSVPFSAGLFAKPGAYQNIAADVYNVAKQPKGERVLQKDLRRDDVTPDEAADQVMNMPEGATLLDVDAPNIKRLGEAIMTEKGASFAQGQRLLESRQDAAPQRVESTIAEVMGDPSTFQDKADEFADQMQNDAVELYRAFRSMPLQKNKEMESIIERLEAAKPGNTNILEMARRLLYAAGDLTPPKKVTADGDQKSRPVVNMTVLDGAKQVLDDVIEAAIAKGEGSKVRAYKKLNDDLKAEMDRQTNGAYAAARNAYEGPAKLDSALKAGRKFLRDDADMTVRKFAEMSDGEKEMFRLGAAKYLRDALLNRSDGRDVAKAFFNNALKREKIRALFPNVDDFNKLAKTFGDEQKMFETQSLLSANSRTAPREAGREQLGADIANAAFDAGTGNVVTAGLGMMRRIFNVFGRDVAAEVARLDEPVRNQIAKILFEGNPAQRDALIRALNARGQIKGSDLVKSGLLGPLNAMATGQSAAGVLTGVSEAQERIRN